jgi:hypothetical protein
VCQMFLESFVIGYRVDTSRYIPRAFRAGRLS